MTDTDQPPKIFDTAKEAYTFFFKNFDHLFRIFIPLSPALMAFPIVGLLVQGDPLENHPVMIPFILLLCLLLSWPFFAAFMIGIHRSVLKGPKDSNAVNIFKMTPSELYYMGVSLLPLGITIGFLILGLFFILGLEILVGPVGTNAYLLFMFCVFCFATWLNLRIGFYFPAVATNTKTTLRQSFLLSDGLPHKMFFSMFLASLPVLGAKFIGTMAVGLMVGLLGLLLNALSLTLSVTVTKVIILLLSVPVLLLEYVSLALVIIILSRYYQWAAKIRKST